MLSKLMKYEFSATGRIFLPIYAALLVMSALARLLYSDRMTADAPRVIATLVITALFTAVAVITVVMTLSRFWTNLLGREGYLMHVLPVKSWKLVLSKLLTMAVWTAASIVVCAAALLIMLLEAGALREVLGFFPGIIGDAFRYMRENEGLAQFVVMIVLLVLTAVLSLFSAILRMYTAMSIGQLANRQRVWAAIGAYIGLGVVFSLISTYALPGAVGIYGYLGSSATVKDILSTASTLIWIAFAISAVKTGALFAATSLLLERRLNLQ